jgi:hypothetical protein
MWSRRGPRPALNRSEGGPQTGNSSPRALRCSRATARFTATEHDTWSQAKPTGPPRREWIILAAAGLATEPSRTACVSARVSAMPRPRGAWHKPSDLRKRSTTDRSWVMNCAGLGAKLLAGFGRGRCLASVVGVSAGPPRSSVSAPRLPRANHHRPQSAVGTTGPVSCLSNVVTIAGSVSSTAPGVATVGSGAPTRPDRLLRDSGQVRDLRPGLGGGQPAGRLAQAFSGMCAHGEELREGLLSPRSARTDMASRASTPKSSELSWSRSSPRISTSPP